MTPDRGDAPEIGPDAHPDPEPPRPYTSLISRIWGPRHLPRAVPRDAYAPPPPSVMTAWRAGRLRWRRQRLLIRALCKARDLRPVETRTGAIRPGDILAFACIRNEAARLPEFLDHHRAMGVAHFLIVDNGSNDGGAEFLARAPDVSLWRTDASYRASRFGMDWLTFLLARYGHGHWCLTLDADELFLYPHHDTRPLRALTDWLEAQGRESYGALMLDLFPKGRLDGAGDAEGGMETPPSARDVLPWCDPDGYRIRVQPKMGNLWIQGGPRARVFFAETPDRAPTLNKLPLVRWNRRFAYVNAAHSLLPTRLNDRHERGHGLLLHTKFLPGITRRAAEEKARAEHFGIPGQYAGYYDALIGGPNLWHPDAVRFEGWRQAEALGLMSRGGWD